MVASTPKEYGTERERESSENRVTLCPSSPERKMSDQQTRKQRHKQRHPTHMGQNGGTLDQIN